MKLFVMLLLIGYSYSYCYYNEIRYSCGAKAPNGQYCNYLSCSAGCCSEQWCSNYVTCACNPSRYDMGLCKNPMPSIVPVNETYTRDVVK